MWLLAFLPPTMGAHFADLIPRALPVIIQGLSDTTDSVREVSIGLARLLSRNALSHHSLLLPGVEDALFDEDWRIRQSLPSCWVTCCTRLVAGTSRARP